MPSRRVLLTVTVVFLVTPWPFRAQDKKPPERSALSPAEAAKTFTVPDALRWDQVLVEPIGQLHRRRIHLFHVPVLGILGSPY